ncbi:hypothetical protein [Neorhizobium petrolearium]|uniref:hypothetical protein n=1 Tax=Neorhizobium petrolearium TaxID=515361 RepID=UPI003F151691
MTIQSVIEQLEQATRGSRSLDTDIAQLIGWRRKVDSIHDPKTGAKTETTLWIVPTGNDPGRVPPYTTSIQAAYDLTQTVAPSNVGGCSWEDGKGSARIDGGPIIQAATPKIALCIAALKRLQQDTGRT